MNKLARLLCCFLGGVVLVVAARTQPTLLIGECVVNVSTSFKTVEMASFAVRCQLAAFGAYLPEESNGLKVVLAPGDEMLACSTLGDSQVHSNFRGAAVIVRRGKCSFQKKLAHVAAAGADAMVLVNSEEALISLSSIEYEHSTAAAVSVTKDDGERLIKFVQDTTDTATGVELRMIAPVDLIKQARTRLQFLADINTPVAMYEEYWDVKEQLHPLVGTLDDLLANILSVDNESSEMLQDAAKVKDFIEFFSWSSGQLSKWGFANQAALHASVAAAVLQLQTWTHHQPKLSEKLLQTAAQRLMEAGYYSHSIALLQRILDSSSTRPEDAVNCQLSFVKFLRGDLTAIRSESTRCSASKLNINVPSLEVAKKAFLQLTKLKTSAHDWKCVEVAAGSVNDTNLGLSCCHLDEDLHGYTGSLLRKFSSEFTEELFHSLVVLGVFLDELGSFNESLRFFSYAANLCDSDRTTLELRQALAVPIIFSSQAEMDKFVEDLKSKLQILTEATTKKKLIEERVISPLGDADNPVEVPNDQATLALRPEAAAYLQYTITPPTMFIGYQGINVLPIQRSINQLRSALYPSLSSSFDRLDGNTSGGNHNLRRIGFISTWFRAHSVGKLLLGVVQNLDRTKFHVSIYRCVHFLSDADDITEAFKEEADEYRELPESQDAAVKILRQAQLDIAIFPELGMDEWTVLLSHHRVAPIQCVFWGHPITTGNPNIDYFISSEHFVSNEFENSLELPNVSEEQLKLSGYRRSFFSEKIVLFRGLSTLFTEPKPLTAESKGITRSRLFLPTNRRLYVCPQTLMKFHPAFDEALAGILDQDDKATIVLLASDTQIVWMEQLRKRFRQRFGRDHRRVLFLPTLPFPEFQALLTQADVVLDPFPFGGGVTTLDALHLGIPVVTLPPAQSVVHLAAGFLRYMNASDCIASSLDEYIELAIRIAKDHADIRQRLLAHQSDIYEDLSTVDDWNAFLSTVTPREQGMK